MRNWRDSLVKIKKYDKIYEWAPTSEAFYRVIKRFIKKEDKILEFGSNTGHISYKLAKEGYDITLLDIRAKSIKIAKNNFKKNNIKAKFIRTDIFDCDNKYDIVWNSGLIQCFDNNTKVELIKKLTTITNRILLFYPDVENPNKKRGANKNEVPGVGDAKEYGTKRVPEIIYTNFNYVYYGILKMDGLRLKYNMHWIYAWNK